MPPEERDKRQQILDAAQKVFAAKGFDGASIKDLAKAAQVSPGLLYWYFKDKTDLFTALLAERIEAGLGQLPEDVSSDVPPQEFLRQFGRLYIAVLEQPMNNALFKLLVANAQSFPTEVRQVQSNVINHVLTTVQSYFQRQIDAGRMRPCNTEMVTRTFMGSIVAYLLLKHVLQEKFAQDQSVEAFVDGVTDVVLHGILPPDR